MVKIAKDFENGNLDEDLPIQEQEDFDEFISGELDKKLDALTMQHGYGKLRAREGHLGSKGFVAADRSGGSHSAASSSARP